MAFEFLRSWFRNFKPREVQLERLGVVRNDRHGNWIGTLDFEPLNIEIDFLFRSGDTPPTIDQVNFLCDVEERFHEIWSQLRETLFEDLDDFEDGTTMDQVFDSLEVTALSFWQVDNHPYLWEISCVTPLDEHAFRIQMRDFENEGFAMDG